MLLPLSRAGGEKALFGGWGAWRVDREQLPSGGGTGAFTCGFGGCSGGMNSLLLQPLELLGFGCITFGGMDGGGTTGFGPTTGGPGCPV